MPFSRRADDTGTRVDRVFAYRPRFNDQSDLTPVFTLLFSVIVSLSSRSFFGPKLPFLRIRPKVQETVLFSEGFFFGFLFRSFPYFTSLQVFVPGYQ